MGAGNPKELSLGMLMMEKWALLRARLDQEQGGTVEQDQEVFLEEVTWCSVLRPEQKLAEWEVFEVILGRGTVLPVGSACFAL